MTTEVTNVVVPYGKHSTKERYRVMATMANKGFIAWEKHLRKVRNKRHAADKRGRATRRAQRRGK